MFGSLVVIAEKNYLQFLYQNFKIQRDGLTLYFQLFCHDIQLSLLNSDPQGIN